MPRRPVAPVSPGRACPRLVAVTARVVAGWMLAGAALATAPATPAPTGLPGASLAVAARGLPFIEVQAPVPTAGCDAADPASCRGDRLAWESLRLEARHDLETGDFAGARAAESAALERAAQARDRDRQSANLAALAAYDAVAGDPLAALRHLAAARARDVHPSPRRTLQLAQVCAFVLAATGHEQQALAAIESGLELALQAPSPHDAAALLSLRARLEARQGDALHASRDITRATVLAGDHPRSELMRALDLDRALLDVATGYKTASILRIDALAAEAAGDGAVALSTDALLAFAQALERVGEAERGRVYRERAAASVDGAVARRRFAVTRPPVVASSTVGRSRQVALRADGDAATVLPLPAGLLLGADCASLSGGAWLLWMLAAARRRRARAQPPSRPARPGGDPAPRTYG